MTDYQAYSPTPEATDEQVKSWFRAKFGYTPHKVLRSKGAILAGPIGAKGKCQTKNAAN